MRKIACSAVAALFALAAVPAGASEGKDSDEAAEKLFETKCSVCHPYKRAEDKRKSREDWEKTVTRMIKGNGAKITDAEAKTIVDYLAKERGM